MTRSECLGLWVKVRVSTISVIVRVIIYLSEETLAPSENAQILATWLIEFHDKTTEDRTKGRQDKPNNKAGRTKGEKMVLKRLYLIGS